ncbi:MAG: class I SAM-dependent methyltransferase [Pseudomonadota bacterium]
MANPVERASLRARFALRQAGRMAWYLGHRAAVRRSANDMTSDPREPRNAEAEERSSGSMYEQSGEKRRNTGRSLTSGRVLGEMRSLILRDLRNIEDGLYAFPDGEDAGLFEQVRRSRLLFNDLPDSTRRRVEGDHQEINNDEWRGRRPRYYLQNFHYQSDGYLSDKSARLYDLQVETLFAGMAGIMRRQCLVPIADFMQGRDQRHTRITDVACGTGRFLKFLKQTYPRIDASASDLSVPYMEEAQRHLGSRKVRFSVANAEQLPFADASHDIVTNIYLFHELPNKVRRTVAAEFARVLKPGGLLVFMDSLQHGDTPGFESMLDAFPHGFHEPYYANYIRDDLDGIFAPAGFEPVSHTPALLSKVSVYRRKSA